VTVIWGVLSKLSNTHAKDSKPPCRKSKTDRATREAGHDNGTEAGKLLPIGVVLPAKDRRKDFHLREPKGGETR